MRIETALLFISFLFFECFSFTLKAGANDACARFLAPEESIQQSKKLTEQILSKIGEKISIVELKSPSQYHLGINGHGTSTYNVQGIPETDLIYRQYRVKRFDHQNVVFRHYTRSLQSLDAIKQNSFLMSGIDPYIQVLPDVEKYRYADLTGIFLTLPGVAAGEVGVAGNDLPYVDLRLPEEVPVLELEPGKIYLVPLYPHPTTLEMSRDASRHVGVIPIQIVSEGKFTESSHENLKRLQKLGIINLLPDAN